MDVETVLKQCEDHLFPVMKMSLRERSIYYHLFRHTRLLGKETGLFAIDMWPSTPVERSLSRIAWASIVGDECIVLPDGSYLLEPL